MFYIWNIFLLSYFWYISVECLIPSLHVQKIDRRLIERKRKDTLDMCKLFTEENKLLEAVNTKGGVENHNSLQRHKRFKRDLNSANSTLDLVVAKRVENIVDKLYDDMAEHGNKVTYRQRDLPAMKTTSKLKPPVHNGTARRFFFVPGMLEASLSSTPVPMVEEDGGYAIPWPKNWKHGIIPYFIDPNTYDTHLSEIMLKAFDYFEKVTCIRLQRLRERPTDKESLQNVEWLYITNPSGIRQCVHSNERKPNRGVQMVVFGYDCLSLGEVLHEIMHVLGFSHEHTRPDRDQHITVLWDNIKPGYKKYFETRKEDPLSSLPYDYSSVLHYPPRAFSKNGQVTLLVKTGIKVGQREGLSDIDIAKVTTIFSPECMKRNKEYLLNTCPHVVKPRSEMKLNLSQNDIENYFKERLWPYGIVNYKIKDNMEFSIEERENLEAVIRHIEKETCIEFRDISVYDEIDKADDQETTQDPNIETQPDEENITTVENETVTPEVVEINDTDSNNNSKENLTSINTGLAKKRRPSNNYMPDFIADSETNNTLRKSFKTVKYVSDFRKKGKLKSDTKNSRVHVKNALKSSYPFGRVSKESSAGKNRVRRETNAGRRHAESTLTLTRSPQPGCRCPPPGKPKGDQVLKINADCFNSVNDLLHLFVHVLGLDHQHNMHDRDSYLHVVWNELTPEILKEMKNKLPPAASVGFPYDYQSVMHYPWLQIKNGVTNIMYPTWNDGWAMGHWQGLSSTDVSKLNLIYYEQCSIRKQHTQEQ